MPLRGLSARGGNDRAAGFLGSGVLDADHGYI